MDIFRRFCFSLVSFLNRAFVSPWGHGGRALVLLLGLFGGVGLSILGFTISYAMAGRGPVEGCFYVFAFAMLIGFIFLPASFFMMRIKRSWIGLLASQFCGVALLFYDPSSPLVVAFGAAALQGPFWACYHFRFSLQRSFGNHGSETALSSLLFALSSAAATIAGGLLLQGGGYLWVLGVGSAFILASTLFLIPRGVLPPFLPAVRRAFTRRRLSCRLSGFSSATLASTDYGLPLWLFSMGLSPALSGMMMAARPVLGFVLTPLVGRMVQKGSRQALIVGACCIILGWGEVAVVCLSGFSPYAYGLGFGFLATGSALIGPAEVGRWYKMRSAAGILAREVSLTLGRIPSILLASVVAFAAPLVYPMVGVFFACLLILESVTGGRLFDRSRRAFFFWGLKG